MSLIWMVLSSICLVHVVNEKNGAQVVAMASISKPDFVEMKKKTGKLTGFFYVFLRYFVILTSPKMNLWK